MRLGASWLRALLGAASVGACASGASCTDGDASDPAAAAPVGDAASGGASRGSSDDAVALTRAVRAKFLASSARAAGPAFALSPDAAGELAGGGGVIDVRSTSTGWRIMPVGASSGAVELETTRWGCGDVAQPWRSGARTASRPNEILEAARGDQPRAWVRNGPSGFQHGYTVDASPACAEGADLWFDVSFGERVTPRLRGRSADLIGTDGRPALRYGDLYAQDAAGKELATTLVATEHGVRIVVATSGAAYPIEVDPLVAAFSSKLSVGDEAMEELGAAIAISGDTAVVGAPSSSHGSRVDAGLAFVFVKSGGTWTEQAVLLSHVPDEREFGASVAIDGDRIVVGAGATPHIFERSGETWSEAAVLELPQTVVGPTIGASVAVSGDTVAVGMPRWFDEVWGYRGAVAVHRFAAGAWSEEALLTADIVGSLDVGTSVALEGDLLVSGAPSYRVDFSDPSGAALVFQRAGAEWSSPVLLRDPAFTPGVGQTVALDGTSILVGAPDAPPQSRGAVLAFELVDGLWQRSGTLVSSAPTFSDRFGRVLVARGGSALVGSATGITAFTRVEATWQETERVAPPADVPTWPTARALALDDGAALVGTRLTGDDGSPRDVAVLERTEEGWEVSGRLGASVAPPVETLPGMAVDGDTAVVGTYQTGGVRDGYAVVFGRQDAGWSRIGRIEAAGLPYFGTRAALDGDTAAFIGSVGQPGGTPTLVVFRRTGGLWVEEARFVDEAYGSWEYGLALDLRDDVVVVGNPRALESRGAVHVYRRVGGTWTADPPVLRAGGQSFERFGESVVFSGDRIVVAAPGTPGPTPPSAAALVELAPNGNGWTTTKTLVHSVHGTQARLGTRLAASDDVLAVGASWTYDAPLYVYRRVDSAWSFAQELQGTLLGGIGVAGTVIAAGHPSADEARVYVDESGSYVLRNVHSVGWPFDQTFGASVAARGSDVLVGLGERGGSEGRLVYAYSLVDVGSSCSSPAECPSGHCVDGVCCDGPCGGGVTTDCLACSVAFGGERDGECTMAAGVVCRPAVGPCDEPEECWGGAEECGWDGAEWSCSTECFVGYCEGEVGATSTCVGQPYDDGSPCGANGMCEGGICSEGDGGGAGGDAAGGAGPTTSSGSEGAGGLGGAGGGSSGAGAGGGGESAGEGGAAAVTTSGTGGAGGHGGAGDGAGGHGGAGHGAGGRGGDGRGGAGGAGTGNGGSGGAGGVVDSTSATAGGGDGGGATSSSNGTGPGATSGAPTATSVSSSVSSGDGGPAPSAPSDGCSCGAAGAPKRSSMPLLAFVTFVALGARRSRRGRAST